MQKHSVSESGIRGECDDSAQMGVKKKMPFQSKEEPEPWRMSLLTTFVSARLNKTWSDLNLTYKQLNAMIDSLCSS